MGAEAGARAGDWREAVSRTLLFPSLPQGPLGDTDSAEGAFGVADMGHGERK